MILPSKQAHLVQQSRSVMRDEEALQQYCVAATTSAPRHKDGTPATGKERDVRKSVVDEPWVQRSDARGLKLPPYCLERGAHGGAVGVSTTGTGQRRCTTQCGRSGGGAPLRGRGDHGGYLSLGFGGTVRCCAQYYGHKYVVGTQRGSRGFCQAFYLLC